MVDDNSGRLVGEAAAAAKELEWEKAANLLAQAGSSSFVLDKRVWYLSRAKRYAEALEILDVLRQREPGNFRHWYMTASQYYEQQHYSDSIALFEESLKRKPDHLQSNWRLAYALHKLGREAHAAPLAARVLQIWHTLQDDERERLAKCAARASHMLAVPQIWQYSEDAVALLNQAVDLEPDDPYHRYRLAQALIRLGRRTDALTVIRKARNLKPGDPSIELEYASILVKSGDTEGALATISRLERRLHGGFAFKAGRLALEAEAPSLSLRLLKVAQRDPATRSSPNLQKLLDQAQSIVPSPAASIQARPLPSPLIEQTEDDKDQSSGRVQIVRPDRHFGFLIDERDGSRRHFRLDVRWQLRPGDIVLFKPVEAQKGPAADDVRPAKASRGVPPKRASQLPGSDS